MGWGQSKKARSDDDLIHAKTEMCQHLKVVGVCPYIDKECVLGEVNAHPGEKLNVKNFQGILKKCAMEPSLVGKMEEETEGKRSLNGQQGISEQTPGDVKPSNGTQLANVGTKEGFVDFGGINQNTLLIIVLILIILFLVYRSDYF